MISIITIKEGFTPVLNEFSTDVCNKLVATRPDRYAKVIKNKGFSTKYIY